LGKEGRVNSKKPLLKDGKLRKATSREPFQQADIKGSKFSQPSVDDSLLGSVGLEHKKLWGRRGRKVGSLSSSSC